MPGSGISLPLDLANIAARCKGSYYAPRRFAAVRSPPPRHPAPQTRATVQH